MSVERPYTGLTALVKLNGEKIGYINNVSLDFDKDIAEILQFGAQYREKVPTIKNWTASTDGTVAFAAGGSQEKLYLAFESGEYVTLRVALDENVYFEGTALMSSLSISGAPDSEMSISAEFEGSGGMTFTLPETVTINIMSGVGGTTSPAGTIKAAQSSSATITVTCTPSAGKKAGSYTIDDGSPVTITGNSFTLTPSSDMVNPGVKVVFVDDE